jgi:hypothetical protein
VATLPFLLLDLEKNPLEIRDLRNSHESPSFLILPPVDRIPQEFGITGMIPSKGDRSGAIEWRHISVVSKLAPSKAMREQVRMLMEAKTTIMKSGDFLSATGFAKLAGLSGSNLSVQPNKWKRNREIFAIRHGREDYLPLYGLNPGDHHPRKEMAEILKVFGDAKDGWGLAFWFAGLNSFLGDERPQDVLATDPERVIAAARDEMAEVYEPGN